MPRFLSRRSRMARFFLDAAAERVPARLVRAACVRATRGLGVAVCGHRVGTPSGPADGDPRLWATEDFLDELIELLRPGAGNTSGSELILTFDDGYADAQRYVASRAPRFTDIQFAVFVCPEKLARRAGYRWNLPQHDGDGGTYDASLDDPTSLDVEGENERADLQALCELPRGALASVEDVFAMAALPNVAIGNHTNCHFNMAALPDARAALDLAGSFALMRRLFGRDAQHFAFPFGVRGVHFKDQHVRMVRRLARCFIWAIDELPYDPAARRPGAVLPRFVVYRSRCARGFALMVAWKCVRARMTDRRAAPMADVGPDALDIAAQSFAARRKDSRPVRSPADPFLAAATGRPGIPAAL